MMGMKARIANIQGAFDVRARKLPLIAGARILLIDDIFTTGATIDEIARILKDAGASRVDFLAFAAAGDMPCLQLMEDADLQKVKPFYDSLFD